MEMQQIIDATMSVTGFSYAQITGNRQTRNLVDARRIISSVARWNFFTWQEIGNAINRDHSTAICLDKKFDDLYESDSDFKEKTDAVLKNLNIPMTKAPKFNLEPPDWMAGYTDLFNVDSRTDKTYWQDCLRNATDGFEHDTDFVILGKYLIAVDNQLCVQQLAEMLYGFEIPFRHTHIPKVNG